LWQFHKMHHSDTEMDSTSASRFHIGEHIMSITAKSVLYFLLGFKLEHIIIVDCIFLSNVIFHHSNIKISERFDRVYRIIFTSPNMHKVHHSIIREETDSNFTAVFSIWDRLFGTYRIVENPEDIKYGVIGLEEQQDFVSLLKTPLYTDELTQKTTK